MTYSPEAAATGGRDPAPPRVDVADAIRRHLAQRNLARIDGNPLKHYTNPTTPKE